jgi:RNA polymerase sigma-70 factor (ECF subfamily)
MPAWGELFEQHHSRILRIAFRITGNSTDAEDVLQTVFLRLVRREDEVDLSAGAASYLYRAAVNAALDLLRTRKRARVVDLAEVEAELPAPASQDPESEHHRRELAARLRGAVSGLSPRAAEIFSLRYFEGYGNREIAEMLATSQTAVAVILHRTRHRLGAQLRPLLGGITP